jgi:hypothetical protein
MSIPATPLAVAGDFSYGCPSLFSENRLSRGAMNSSLKEAVELEKQLRKLFIFSEYLFASSCCPWEKQ